MKTTLKFVLSAALALSVSAVAPAQNRPQAERITNGPVLEGSGNSWAVIAWTTDTGGSTVVRYGIDRNHLTQTAEAPYSDNEHSQRGQNHRVRINSLQPGTTYYYRVDSGQGEGTGTEAMSPIQQFTTKGGNGGREHEGSGQAERITSGPTIRASGPNSAEVVWTTNTGGSSIVRYGTDPNRLAQTAEAPYVDTEGTATQSHRVRLRNLQPGTTYYYRVDSGQGEGTGTEAMSPIQQFTAGANGFGAYGYNGTNRSGAQGYNGNNGYSGGNNNPAAQVGYQDGVNDGRSARQSGQGADVRQQQAYEHADHNYSPSYGDRQQYKDAYRQAYQLGYQQGYDGADRDGYGRAAEGVTGGYEGQQSPAQQVGYQDGLNDGRSARQSGQGADPRQQQAYEHADHNYSPSYGDRQLYKDAYRQAYQQGYDHGYNGSSPQDPQ